MLKNLSEYVIEILYEFCLSLDLRFRGITLFERNHKDVASGNFSVDGTGGQSPDFVTIETTFCED